jgi:type III restriction enzyme
MAEVIENPILNSPYREPTRHFATTVDGRVTGEIEERRRPSEFFVPVAPPEMRAPQLMLDLNPAQRQFNEVVKVVAV